MSGHERACSLALRGARGQRILLDGAMGTALLARGLPPGALPDAWLLARPEAIRAVHAEHAAAGADVLLTCTFHLASTRLDPALDRARLAEAAVRLAREAGPRALVAGALGPSGLAGPGRPADRDLARRAYRSAADALARAGADLIWIESQLDVAEARAALAACREAGVSAVVTFTLREREGRLEAFDGTPGPACLAAVAAEGAEAAGVNCVFPGPPLDALAAWAAEGLPVPFVAKPSPGLPGAILPPAAFAVALAPALASGMRLAGGCCGATGAHLAALAAAWRDRES